MPLTSRRLGAALVAGVGALALLGACAQPPPQNSAQATGTAVDPTGLGSTGDATGAPADPDAAQPTVAPTQAGAVGLEVVSATGAVDFKTAPKVAFSKLPVSTTESAMKVLTPGSGAAATKADTVGLRGQIYNGTTGELLDDGFAAERPVETYRLAREDLIPGFVQGLTGAQKGSRIAFAIPPHLAFGAAGNDQLGIGGQDTIVVVADITSVTTTLTKIDGEMKTAPANLPQVTFPNGPTKDPVVKLPGGAAPTTTQQFTLIEGTGPEVQKGQLMTAQYQGSLWKDGKIFDSSWKRGAPADFAIGVGQVIPGWDKALVGKKVGSRVLIVIPPADGYGSQGMAPDIGPTDTLVFVVDILDAN